MMSELCHGVKNGRIAWRYFQPNRRHVFVFVVVDFFKESNLTFFLNSASLFH